jgi:hypothetical protein
MRHPYPRGIIASCASFLLLVGCGSGYLSTRTSSPKNLSDTCSNDQAALMATVLEESNSDEKAMTIEEIQEQPTGCSQSLVGGTTYYVSPAGIDDSSRGKSLSTPLKTIKKALSMALTSGDIVYVRTGTYAETISIAQSGITLSAYPGDRPIIDGGSTLPSGDWGALLSVGGNNNAISGFEIKNSNTSGTRLGGYGVAVVGHHNTISKMDVHHAWGQGIIVQGDYNIVEDSRIWQSARQNSANPGSTGWGTGLSAARNRSASALKPGITSYATLRRNTVFNNWGEGLSCFETDHCTMEDNIVYDNWAVNLYLSDATNSLVQRNLIYISSAPAIPFRSATPGFTLADEIASKPRSANNTIINNFIYRTNLQAFSWTLVPNSGLNNVLIAYNTIVDGNLSTGFGGGSSIVNTNSQIRNNIILGRNSYVPNKSGITFSNNNWAVTPSLAAAAGDIVGDPRISRTGTTTPGALTSAYFKILAGSPVINAAMSLANVTGDFFQAARGTSPDMGGHEYNGIVPSINLALNRPVTVSSTQPSDAAGSYSGNFVVDGNNATRWSSVFADSQWIAIDLGSRKPIRRVVLNWERAYGRSYKIQISDDNVTWKDIFTTGSGNGGIDDLLGLSGTGRYIRMLGTTRGTAWGYSLYEMSVY